MDFQPLQSMLLCKKVVDEKISTIENGIHFEKEQVPLFEILKIGSQVKTKFNVGDVISINAVPAELDKKEKIYLVSEKNVAAVVQ